MTAALSGVPDSRIMRSEPDGVGPSCATLPLSSMARPLSAVNCNRSTESLSPENLTLAATSRAVPPAIES